MNGKAGAPKATPEVSAAIDNEIRRLASLPDGWDTAVHKLAQAGDPTTANNLSPNDWYHLHRALEVITVCHNAKRLLSQLLVFTHKYMPLKDQVESHVFFTSFEFVSWGLSVFRFCIFFCSTCTTFF